MRGGISPWFVAATPPPYPTLSENLGCDALIVGAGITGSLVAERLTRQGLDVVIVDRERPAGAARQPAPRCCCGRSTVRLSN
nr:FAD-dependent oxidoreductase [Bradyrhizobium altum]